MKLSIYIAGLPEDKDDVTFTGTVYLTKEEKQTLEYPGDPAHYEVDEDLQWDETLYTKEENDIIGNAFHYVEGKMIEHFKVHGDN